MRIPSFARGLPSAMRDPVIVLAIVGLVLTIAASTAHAAEVKLFEEGQQGVEFSQETLQLYFGEVPATLTMQPVTRAEDIQSLLSCARSFAECAPVEVFATTTASQEVVVEVEAAASSWLYPHGEEPCETPDGICIDMDEDYVYVDEVPPVHEQPALPLQDVQIVQALYHP